MYNKTLLLDSVFVISRIIKVLVRVISLRLRLITPTSTSIILDITKTSSNNNCLQFSCFMRKEVLIVYGGYGCYQFIQIRTTTPVRCLEKMKRTMIAEINFSLIKVEAYALTACITNYPSRAGLFEARLS